MEGISIFNPLSSKYHALDEYKKLTTAQKIMTVVTTFFGTIATLGLGSVAIFRKMVIHYKNIGPGTPDDKTQKIGAKELDASKAIIQALQNNTSEVIVNSLEEFGNYSKMEVELGGSKRFIYTDDAVACISNVDTKIPEEIANLVKPTPGGTDALTHSIAIDHFEELLPEKQDTLGDMIDRMIRSAESDLAKEIQEANARVKKTIIKGTIEEDKEEKLLAAPIQDSLFLSGVLKTQEREELGLKEDECNFVPYVEDLFTSKIHNNAVIGFENGKIVLAKSDKHAKDARKLLPIFLKETYGTVLGEAAMKRYRLHKKETVTLLDVKKALISVASNVRKRDLERLFRSIKREIPSYRASQSLVDAPLYQQIKAKEAFDDLNSQEIDFLRSAFSLGIPFKTLKADQNEDYFFWHDLECLKEMSFWDDLKMDSPKLAIGEYLGKGIGYLELNTDMVVPVPDQNGQLQFYKVSHSLENKNDAVIAHILNPLNESQGDSETGYLLFRGTNMDPGALSGPESVARDLEDGVGDVTYGKREAEIQDMVENYLASVQKDNVTLHVAAHSLGGCDAQRALVSILEKVAAAQDGSPWKKLKNLIVTAYNAPGPNIEVNNRLKKVLKNDLKINVELTHVRYFDKETEDVLQMQGELLIGADLTNDGVEGQPLQEASSFFKREMIRITMHDERVNARTSLISHGYRNYYKNHHTVVQNDKRMGCKVEHLTPEGQTIDGEKSDMTPEACIKEFERVCIGDRKFDDKEMGLKNRFCWGVVDYVRSSLKMTVQPVLKGIYDRLNATIPEASVSKRRHAFTNALNKYHKRIKKAL